jgi:hypothetical protein
MNYPRRGCYKITNPQRYKVSRRKKNWTRVPWASDTKTDWPIDCRSYCNFDFDFHIRIIRYLYCDFGISDIVCYGRASFLFLEVKLWSCRPLCKNTLDRLDQNSTSRIVPSYLLGRTTLGWLINISSQDIGIIWSKYRNFVFNSSEFIWCVCFLGLQYLSNELHTRSWK